MSRTKEIREKLGFSQQDFADRLGEKRHKIADIETGKQKLPIEIAEKIEEIFHINPWWLLTGKGEMVILEAENLPIAQEKHTEDDKNTISVNYYPDVYAAAGNGGINGDAKPEIMTVSRSFLSNMFGLSSFVGIDIINVVGDSMEPFIPNGETILLQRTHEARNNQVIIARINDELYVKRLLRDPLGRWVKLISDNQQYPDIDLNQEEMKQLEIIGIVYGRYRPIS